mgnify:FL=1
MDVYQCSFCKHVGKKSEFHTEYGHCCPKCKSEDGFPHRFFKCKVCGRIATQDEWFPEYPLDDNPLEENGVEAICCDNCLDLKDGSDFDGESATLEIVPIDAEAIIPEEVRQLVGDLLIPDALFLWWFDPGAGYRNWTPRDEWGSDQSNVIRFIESVKVGRPGYSFF